MAPSATSGLSDSAGKHEGSRIKFGHAVPVSSEIDDFADYFSGPDIDEGAWQPEVPDWYYPLVGEVTSETVLLEYYAAALALRISTGGDASAADIRAMVAGSRSWRKLLQSTRDDPAFKGLVPRIEQVRDQRHRVVHGVLWWFETDGPHGDFFVLQDPKDAASDGTIVGQQTRRDLQEVVSRIKKLIAEVVEADRDLDRVQMLALMERRHRDRGDRS